MSDFPNRKPDPDPFGNNAVKTYARIIIRTVNDPNLVPDIPRRVGREIVNGSISSKSVGEVLDRIETLRETGELECAGAFFVCCMQRLFKRHNIPWHRKCGGIR